MEITYPSVQSANQYYGSDAITVFPTSPGPVAADSGKTFSICLYTNCQTPYLMTPCDYSIVTVDTSSLVGTILGMESGDYGTAPVNPSDPEEPKETETPEEPADPVLPDSANTERARELAVKAEDFYASLAGTYNTEAEKAIDAEFSDMYAESAARAHGFTEAEKETMPLEEYLDKSESKAGEFERSGDVCIKAGAGELASIMGSILKAASEEISLEEALAAFAVSGNDEENPYVREKAGNAKADLLWINTESGEVTAAVNKGRIALDNDVETLFSDDEAVMKLADDLAAFIRYAMFAGEDIDSERVRAFLAHLINKQAYADYGRYILDLDADTDIDAAAELIKANLAAASAMLEAYAGGEKNGEVDGEEEQEENDGGLHTVDEEDTSPNESAQEKTAPSGLSPIPAPEEELEEIIGGLKENR